MINLRTTRALPVIPKKKINAYKVINVTLIGKRFSKAIGGESLFVVVDGKARVLNVAVALTSKSFGRFCHAMNGRLIELNRRESHCWPVKDK